MSYRQARRLQDRVNLDQLVRIRRYTVLNDAGQYGPPATTDDPEVWCLREDGRSGLAVGAKSTTLIFPAAVIIRYDPGLESLDGQRVTVTFPESPEREDTVSNVEIVGRRRFLRLEIKA